MSTTDTFQGMDVEAKPSSRVLAPPGGGSSNIFGTFNDAPAQKRTAAPQPQSDVLNQGPAQPAAQPQKQNPRIAYNPITGQPYETKKTVAAEEEKQEEKKQEASAVEAENKAPEQSKAAGAPSDNFRSTRVSQPPGGRSTQLW